MAQALDEFEREIEQPLDALLRRGDAIPEVVRVLEAIPAVKRAFRKKLQALGTDCIDLMPSDMQINAFEPMRSSR
jgi:hypothetical protein